MGNNTLTRMRIQDMADFPVFNAAIQLVGRVLISVIFLISGYWKISAPRGTIDYIASAGLPFPQLGFGIAVLVEFGCAIALIGGYHTRFVAAVLAIFSIAAALSFHNNLADQDQFVHFLKNLAMAGGLLQLVGFGAGAISLDARRR